MSENARRAPEINLKAATMRAPIIIGPPRQSAMVAIGVATQAV
jgi:hypothetical protein